MADPVAVYFQTGINYYVPKMQAAPGVGDDGLYTQSLGTPIAASVNNIIATAQGAITNAAKTFNATSNTTLPFTIDAIFGRAVQITGGTAGDNAVLTVRGVDYLGQPVAENLTLNGVTAATGNKAFKRIDSISVPAGNANASSSIQVGVTGKLGLPFKTQAVVYEFVGDVLASAGTLVQPNLTDPQTLTTGDPRGTYTPSSTLNGTNVISINARTSAVRNTNDNGGLHGVRHFFS
jgi:hypothetical protein